MTERGRVIIKIGFVVATVSVLFFATASPSFAQVDDVTDSVSDAADSAGDAVDDTTDKVNDTADDATEAVDSAAGGNETVDGATDEVDDAVDTVTDTADETADRGSDTVDKTTDKVNEQLGGEDEEGRRHPLDETLREASGVLGNVLDETLGSDEGTSGTATRRESGKRVGNESSVRGSRYNQRNEAKPALDRVLGSVQGNALISAASATDGSGSEESASESITQRILESFARVATRMAFPLALLALVAAFLIVQSRVDRNDPKLVLAPLDAEQEYLSFR